MHAKKQVFTHMHRHRCTPNRSGFTVWHRWGWLNNNRPTFFPTCICLFVWFDVIPKSSCLTNEHLQCRGHMVPRGYEDSLTLNVSVELINAICVRTGVVWCTPFGYPHQPRIDIKTYNRWTRHSSVKQRTSTHTNSRFGEISVNKRIMQHTMYDNSNVFLRAHYFLLRLSDLSCNWKTHNFTKHPIVLHSQHSFVFTTV